MYFLFLCNRPSGLINTCICRKRSLNTAASDFPSVSDQPDKVCIVAKWVNTFVREILSVDPTVSKLQSKFWKSSLFLPELWRLCPETSTKLYVHEFGFRGHTIEGLGYKYILQCTTHPRRFLPTLSAGLKAPMPCIGKKGGEGGWEGDGKCAF